MNLTIKNASITIGAKTILEYINFEIKNSEHIAIVGRNGAGKTTLLKAIIDNSMFQSGIGEEEFNIIKYGKFSIGYLSQMSFDNESNTLLEEILKSFKEIISIEKRIKEYVDRMQTDTSDKCIKEYTELLDYYEAIGGYTYQKEYEIMLKKFGFTESDKEKKISSFSGGQKTKIAFIKLLLSHPDLLILDEPTNHLDIEAIEWLEEYLRKYKKAIIIVSHDRMFIDHVATIIYDIEYGRTTRYVGNYAHYEEEKRKNYEKALYDYEYQQKEIKRLREIYERFRFKPSKASLAMSRLHQLEKMDILEKPNKIDTKVFKTNLSKIIPSSTNVVSLKELTIGYKDPLANLSLDILKGMKIGVIGENGIGKSTLLKTINEIIKPLQGKVSYGYNVSVGYFDQSLGFEIENGTILEEFKAYVPELTEEEHRRALGSFLFKGNDVNKKLDVLSGGEKVRLQLCKILFNKPNFLILDEPTNHLDIVGKEHLEEILKEYKGTIIFVSHDRYFIKKIATQLLVFEKEGVSYFPYGYEEYIKKRKEEEIVVKEKGIKKEKKKEDKEDQKKIKKVEKEITNVENKIKELTQELGKEANYTDYEKANSINKEIENLRKQLNALNDLWEKLVDSTNS